MIPWLLCVKVGNQFQSTQPVAPTQLCGCLAISWANSQVRNDERPEKTPFLDRIFTYAVLQHVIGIMRIESAQAQRPRIGLHVVLFQLRSDLMVVHCPSLASSTAC